MIKVNNKVLLPTIFPDRTSQIWKLGITDWDNNVIIWHFENEAEIFHICQLADLLKSVGIRSRLSIPYLPYARQDKGISNITTFALHTFARIINSCGFYEVSFVDVHSNIALGLIKNSINNIPFNRIKSTMRCLNNPLLAYPDKGACDRYIKLLTSVDSPIVGHKSRNQQTGYLEYLGVVGNPRNRDILVIDDICDGGMTFILFAKKLYELGANSVNLYVTHGIFSKGFEVLRAAKIKRIFTYKGEVDA